MSYAVKVSTDNKVSLLELKGISSIGDTIRADMGGWMEIVRATRLKRPLVMIVDEEGLLKQLPVNKFGSWLYGADRHGNPIAGAIYILRENVEDLEGLSLETAEKMKGDIERALL